MNQKQSGGQNQKVKDQTTVPSDLQAELLTRGQTQKVLGKTPEVPGFLMVPETQKQSAAIRLSRRMHENTSHTGCVTYITRMDR